MKAVLQDKEGRAYEVFGWDQGLTLDELKTINNLISKKSDLVDYISFSYNRLNFVHHFSDHLNLLENFKFDWLKLYTYAGVNVNDFINP